MQSGPSQFPVKRLVIIIALGACLCAAVYFTPAFFANRDKDGAGSKMQLGGTASAFFMIDGWKQKYHESKGIKIEYVSVGSTKGIDGMIDKNYILGFTHAPMTEEQKKKAQEKGGEVVQIPVVICAVVPVYNVPGLKWKDKEKKDKPTLNFTAEVLGKIFVGEITTWNDPELAKDNDQVDLPADAKINVIHRKESSGTTFVFTDYLYGASSAWRRKMGDKGKPSAKVDWLVGTGVARSTDVNDKVTTTDNAISYVDLLYAYPDKIAYGAVQNTHDKKKFIKAAPTTMTPAADGLTGQSLDDLKFTLTNRPADDAYPICGAIWAVCYRSLPADSQKLAVDFLQWITHDGQAFAAKRSFAPLPPELVKGVEQKIDSIKAAQ